MMISEDRQTRLAQLICDVIWNDDLVDYSDEDVALRLAKRAIAEFAAQLEDVDRHARQTVASLKRQVIEGSPEWDVLYRKYFEEEMKRRGN